MPPAEVGGGPRQHPSGTRPGRYRCSLPGLAGFAVGRRGGTDADRHGSGPGATLRDGRRARAARADPPDRRGGIEAARRYRRGPGVSTGGEGAVRRVPPALRGARAAVGVAAAVGMEGGIVRARHRRARTRARSARVVFGAKRGEHDMAGARSLRSRRASHSNPVGSSTHLRHHIETKKGGPDGPPFFVSIWRRGWDSNPRGAQCPQPISSRCRCDRFGTSPGGSGPRGAGSGYSSRMVRRVDHCAAGSAAAARPLRRARGVPE